MRFGRTLDAILELAAIVRELLGHFVDPARYIAIGRGSKVHGLADLEFMCVLRAVDRDPVLRSRHDARFRLLSAQEKTLASCGSQGLFGRMG